MHEPKSDYEYNRDGFIISITDLNLGNMSVTNNIENVVKAIGKREAIDMTQYMIVYCDSEGRWDGWDARTNQFVAFGAKSYDDAVNKYRLKLELNTAEAVKNNRYQLNLLVVGAVGSGKTNVALYVKKQLEQLGALVEIDDIDASQKMLTKDDFEHLRNVPLKVFIKTIQTKWPPVSGDATLNFKMMSDIERDNYWSDKIKEFKNITSTEKTIGRGTRVQHPVRGDGMITHVHNERVVEAVFFNDPQSILQTDTDILRFFGS